MYLVLMMKPEELERYRNGAFNKLYAEKADIEFYEQVAKTCEAMQMAGAVAGLQLDQLVELHPFPTSTDVRINPTPKER